MHQSGDFLSTPFVLLLEVMARDARNDVDQGVNHLKALIKRDAGHRWLLVYVREAVRQLHRSYVALAGEVTLLGGPAASGATGLERISRRELVHRVHRTGGDFSLIARQCDALGAIPGRGAAVDETHAVLRRWANRDVHLFRILVPLVNYAEELKADVANALSQPEARGALLDACLRNTHRAMAPVFRELSLSARGLQDFGLELDAVVPPSLVPARRLAPRPRP